MKNISDITKLLNENGVSFEVKESITLDSIDFEKSYKNQVRPVESIIKEKVEDYSIAMKHGDEFPPVLLTVDGSGKYIIRDGNHRLSAAKQNGMGMYPYGAIICDASVATMTMVGQQINMTNGIPQSREDRIRAAISLVKTRGITQREAAKKFRLNENIISLRMSHERAKSSVKKVLGASSGNQFSGTAAAALRIISDEDVFAEAVKHAKLAKMKAPDCVDFSAKVRTFNSASKQLEYIKAENEKVNIIKSETAGMDNNIVTAKRLSKSMMLSAEKLKKLDFESFPDQAKLQIAENIDSVNEIIESVKRSIANAM